MYLYMYNVYVFEQFSPFLFLSINSCVQVASRVDSQLA